VETNYGLSVDDTLFKVYGHLPLIMNDDGSKLSKRQSDIHLQHFRDEGYYPEAIINFVTMSGGGFKDREQVEP
jgi:glutamyl-tRNA synthetase